MDFNYSPEDEAFRSEFRAWLENNRQYATPAREPLADESDGEWDARIRWHRKLNEGGWIGLSWPREYGGRGATLLQSIIYEAGTRACRHRHSVHRFRHSAARPDPHPLGHRGAEAPPPAENSHRRGNLVPGLLGAQLGLRPGLGADPRGRGRRLLRRQRIENLDLAARSHADWIFLLARTDTEAPKHKGISYLLVDMKTPE